MTHFNPPGKLLHTHAKKLLFLLLFIMSFQTEAQNTSINLDFQERPLSEVLRAFEQQSGLRFIYNSAKINTNLPVSVKLTNVRVERALEGIFQKLPYTYRLQGEQVLLVEKTVGVSRPAQQTERQISGKVVAQKTGEPLPGATVLIRGSGVGAMTNSEGNFIYTVKTADIPNTELEVKFLGMKPEIRRIGDNEYFFFQLEEEASELDQVILTSSYGTKKLKEEVVGSIATLESEEIQVQQAYESLDKMLEGQLAGVLIENTSGIGGPLKINVRGQGTLSPLNNPFLGTSTQPLIIVDGVVLTEEMVIDNSLFDGTGTFDETLANPLAQIAPEDVESVSVLKDAAAVSIYGADGANGVILITTKKGKRGEARFGFSTQLGISEAINQIEYLSGAQYTELRNEYLRNRGQAEIPYNGVDTDWFDLLNQSGIYNKYNFNVSGATRTFDYRASASYVDIEEPQVGNGSEQLNVNLNLGYGTNKFNVGLSLSPSYVVRETPNIYYNFAFLPTLAPYNEDGTFADLGVSGLANPLAAAEQNLNETKTYSVLGSFNVEYELFEGFEISSLFGLNLTEKDQDRYFSAENESGRYNGTFVLDGVSYPRWGRRVLNERDSRKWNWQSQAYYETEIGQHSFDVLAGIELSEEKTDFAFASGRGFVNPNVLNDVEDALIDDDPTTEVDESRDNQSYDSDINYNSRVSFYSQLNYDYLGKYFLLGNFRRDESSVFGSDTDVAYNGGVGLSWVISKEGFFEDAGWLDFLRLRTSYGSTGNSRIGSYRSRGLYTTGIDGYNGLEYANPSAAPNPRLSWEKNTKFNVGLDFNVFNRLSLTLEYFYDDIEDLITSRNLPTETGYNSLQLNAASMYNKGYELSARMNWIDTEAFQWKSSFNLATLESEVTDLVGLGSDFSTSAAALAQKIGYSTTTIWGIKWVGIDPGTGRDLVSKDGEIYDAATYRSLFDESDWEPIGDRQPDFYGGFSNTFTFFKNLNLSIRGSYQFGGEYLVTHDLISNYRITLNRNLSVNAYDYWREQGDVVQQPVVTNDNPVIPNLSKYVYDDSYIKLANVNLSYNFPMDQTRLFLDDLSVFVDASNVYYWYKEEAPEGMDGIREFRFIYPQARTISVGLKTSF